MSDPPPPDEDEDDLAAEYVLGLLAGPEQARAAERVRTDRAFRDEVEAWERRLAPLLDQVASATPPPGVWERVAAAIEPGANVVAIPTRAAFWDRVGVWRTATAASLAAAAACLSVILLRPSPVPSLAPTAHTEGAVLSATLASAAGKPLFVATVDTSRSGVAVVPVANLEGHGRYPELWIIPAGGGPKPVGMVQAGHLQLPTLAGARPSDVFAVSLEPAGGSPTGAPTGPVIATGTIRAL